MKPQATNENPKRNRKTIAIIITAVIVAFALGTQAPKLIPTIRIPANPTHQQTASSTEQELPMTISSIKESTPLYTVNAEYPQFPSLAAPLGRVIDAEVRSRIAEFKKNAADNWKARQDTTPAGQPKEQYPQTPFDFIATWEPKQLNTNTVSLIVRFESYEGGANTRQELVTYDYDVQTNKMIGLGDLFPNDPNYLPTIADAARQELLQDLTTASQGNVQMDMLQQGTAPTPDNFKNFTFNDYAIEFYFPKYQVAPGVFGEQSVLYSRR